MPDIVTIRFYAGLNDFLPQYLRHAPIEHKLKQPRSVKDLIESLGVPHTEIELIMVNGKARGFSYLLKKADYISVYPQFKLFDISSLSHCRPVPLPPRFVLDVHLGRLAAYLRMLGLDTLYNNEYDDVTLTKISSQERRILLTYDKQLLMRKKITHGHFVRSRQPKQQILEVVSHFNLYNQLAPFTRCMLCNGHIKKIEKNSILARLPENTEKYYDEFFICISCNKIYWKGSHYLRMTEIIKSCISLKNKQVTH